MDAYWYTVSLLITLLFSRYFAVNFKNYTWANNKWISNKVNNAANIAKIGRRNFRWWKFYMTNFSDISKVFRNLQEISALGRNVCLKSMKAFPCSIIFVKFYGSGFLECLHPRLYPLIMFFWHFFFS